MTNLNDIVSTFSKEEQQRFISYLEQKNKRKDAKNIQLFKLLLKNDISSSSIIKIAIKSCNSKTLIMTSPV